MDFSKVTALQIPEGNVTKIETKDGKVLWDNLNKFAYGIRWSTNTGTACERIGNLQLHKTLPIQSKFKVCVHQGTDIKYYCHPDDSRFVEDSKKAEFTHQKADMNLTACDGLPTGVVSCEENSVVKCKFINENLFSNYRFLYSYVYIQDNVSNAMAIGRIVYIDTSTHEAYIDDSENIQLSDYVHNESVDRYKVYEAIDRPWFSDNYTVELGCSINGYDGEIGVDTGGKFYQWSVDNEGNGNEVWISEYKCVSYAKEVKRHIIGCSRACVLNTSFNDTKWGWIGSLQADTAVNIINYNQNLRGGSNSDIWDKYLGVDNFRCQLNKGRTNIPLAKMREYTRKLANHQVLYKQLWEAIVWCWCIEYAQLDVKQTFNPALTTDGYHQGGLGKSYSVGGYDLEKYNNNECFTPCDYTLNLGNKTDIRIREKRYFDIDVAANHFWNYYLLMFMDYSLSSDNKILTITNIDIKKGPNIIVSELSVSGKHTYTISGLTDSQSIIFKTERGSTDVTITDDGTYEINWGDTPESRFINFSKSQTECNIVITIEKAPSATVSGYTELSWDVPHWRGFNGFWYGDVWITIENFLSKYDSTKQKRIYYWTDDVTKFNDAIDNKEHSIEDIVAPINSTVEEFNIGTQGNLTPRSYGVYQSGKYVFHFDNNDTSIHKTSAGGITDHIAHCGLGYLDSSVSSSIGSKSSAFVTCTIIN